MLITSFVDAFLVKINVIGCKRLVGWFFMEGGEGEENSFSFFLCLDICLQLVFFNSIRIQNTRLGRQVFYQIHVHVYRLHYDYD